MQFKRIRTLLVLVQKSKFFFDTDEENITMIKKYQKKLGIIKEFKTEGYDTEKIFISWVKQN